MTDWTPAFHGQRPPFAPGNEAALTHGATSPRRVGEAAQEVLQRMLADPATPSYLRDDPSYYGALRDLARQEAVVGLLFGWLDANLVDGQGVSDKANRRLMGVLEQLHRHMSALDNKRKRLGLDPLSRARLMKDLQATPKGLDLAQMWADEQGGDADGGA